MPRFKYECETQYICNENAIYPAMRQLIEKEKMSAKGAARFIHEDSGGQVTVERARQVWIRRTKGEVQAVPDKEIDAVKTSYDFKKACKDFGVSKKEQDKLAKAIGRGRRNAIRRSVKQYAHQRAEQQATDKADDILDIGKEFVARLKKCEKLSDQLTGELNGLKKLLNANGYGVEPVHYGVLPTKQFEPIITLGLLKKIGCDWSFQQIVGTLVVIYRFQKYYFEDCNPDLEKDLESIRKYCDEQKAQMVKPVKLIKRRKQSKTKSKKTAKTKK